MCHPHDFLREKMFNPKRVTKLAHLTVSNIQINFTNVDAVFLECEILIERQTFAIHFNNIN
jgi:hypothetical protein